MKNCEREDFQQVAAACIELFISKTDTDRATNKYLGKEAYQKINRICGIEIPDDWVKWMNEECAPKPVLDQKEHDYLEGVIRPFKQGVAYIKKHEDSLKEDEYIYITMKAAGGFCLPYFTKNSMYKGMELNKAYLPKELGL